MKPKSIANRSSYSTLMCAVCVLLSLQGLASDTCILMRKIPYNKVFAQARAEKKPILLYFHYKECGACISMERTVFRDTAVARFYNKHFVCYEINTRMGEGININKKEYHVQLHPTFLYLDAERKELNKLVGTSTPEEFIQHGKNALDARHTLAYLKQQYKLGNRDGDFLYEYCYRLRDANELDSLRVNEYLQTQTASDLTKEKNLRFLYEFALHRGQCMISSDSREYRFMQVNKAQFYAYFEPEQVDTRLTFIVQDEVYRAIQQGQQLRFEQQLAALQEFDTGKEYYYKEMDGRITMWTNSRHLVAEARLAFAEKQQDTVQYKRLLDDFIRLIWDDHAALNTLAWSLFEKSPTKDILEKALTCAQRSVQLKSYYANHDTFAWLLYQLGRDEKALQEANLAISLAEETKEDHRATDELLTKIRKRMEGNKH